MTGSNGINRFRERLCATTEGALNRPADSQSKDSKLLRRSTRLSLRITDDEPAGSVAGRRGAVKLTRNAQIAQLASSLLIFAD